MMMREQGILANRKENMLNYRRYSKILEELSFKDAGNEKSH